MPNIGPIELLIICTIGLCLITLVIAAGAVVWSVIRRKNP